MNINKNKQLFTYDLDLSIDNINLSELKLGQKVQVIGIDPSCNNYYRQRLLAQGVIPGSFIQIKKIAPLGDPIELLLSSGRSFIVRKNEANVIRVIKVFN